MPGPIGMGSPLALAVRAEAEGRQVLCECGQLVMTVTPSGTVYPWGRRFRVERDGRLAVDCPKCGERVRFRVELP